MSATIRERPTGFLVDPQAVFEGRHLGLGGDVQKRLARMARRAAPITHEDGNRRFDDFLLTVEKWTVVSVSRI